MLLSPLRLLGRITVQEPTFRDVVLVYRLKPWALEEAMAAGLGVPPPLDTAACAETAASANADDAADDRDHDAMIPASTSVPPGGGGGGGGEEDSTGGAAGGSNIYVRHYRDVPLSDVELPVERSPNAPEH